MNSSGRGFLPKLLSGAVAFAAGTWNHHAAQACDLGWTPIQIMPSAEADAVPRNGILIATGRGGITPDFALETAAGKSVAVTTTCVGSQPMSGMVEVCMARPTAELAPGTYRWTAGGTSGSPERTFTVINALDEQPPAASPWSVAAAADTEPGACGEGQNDIVRFDFIIDALPEDTLFIAGPADVDAVYGASTQASFSDSTFESRLGGYAERGCLQARLLDGAGNITQLEPSCYETSGCGCRLQGTSKGRAGWYWSVLVLGLWRLRSLRASSRYPRRCQPDRRR